MYANDFFRIKPYKSMMQNSLWYHDAYPDLPELAPYGRIEIGRFDGIGLVRTIHLTLNIEGGNLAELQRGVFLEGRYDGMDFASIYAPVGDFFCDSFNGESIFFSSLVMAKRPTNSLFCYAPMPFRKGIVLSLINKTDKKVGGYGYVTAEQVPEWQDDFGYFHARWLDNMFRLPQQQVPLLEAKGKGHFFGCHMTVVSSCPHFRDNMGICEGNDEFYIDGSTEPVCNYLGTEDFFGFSWNWRKTWYDTHAGTTFLKEDESTKLACYRFLLNDPVRFSQSLKAQINYRFEVKNPFLNKAKAENNGDARFSIVTYWYLDRPVDSNPG